MLHAAKLLYAVVQIFLIGGQQAYNHLRVASDVGSDCMYETCSACVIQPHTETKNTFEYSIAVHNTL